LSDERWFLVLLCLILLTLLTSPVQAQPQAKPAVDQYELTWSTYDTGGGTVTSADGDYSLTTTAGQPDASSQVWAGYTLDGGFWHSGMAGGSIYIPVVVR
jgi:hypothetical protein